MLNVYSFYDSKAKTYHTPFFLKQDGQAIRAFLDLVNNPQTDIAKYPEDFSLFKLGQFDDETGCIYPDEKVPCLVRAWELVNKE